MKRLHVLLGALAVMTGRLQPSEVAGAQMADPPRTIRRGTVWPVRQPAVRADGSTKTMSAAREDRAGF
jgi:hypothetical protein